MKVQVTKTCKCGKEVWKQYIELSQEEFDKADGIRSVVLNKNGEQFFVDSFNGVCDDCFDKELDEMFPEK